MGTSITIRVEGMGCQGCVAAVEKAVRSVEAGAGVTVDLGTGTVRIEASAPDRVKIEAAIVAAGYEIAA